MELFDRARAVRLRGHHGKYLTAEEDEERVTQSRDGSAPGARWEVEFVDGGRALRLRSCYGRYLTATSEAFLLGATGKKVLQTLPAAPSVDSSIEWEPLREGFQVKLKSRSGHFLRANGFLPPWRNSITHDLPHRTATQDWVLWDVDIVQIQIQIQPAAAPAPVPTTAAPSASSAASAAPLSTPDTSSSSSSSSPSGPSDPDDSPDWSSSSHSASSPPQSFPSFAAPAQGGRTIHYTIADDRGNVDDSAEWPSFTFIGTSVPDLTHKLKQMTHLDDIIVCTRNPVKRGLSPLYLQLPPNNRTMWLVVVDAESRFGRTFVI